MIEFMKRGLVISSALLTLGFFTSADLGREVHAEEMQKSNEDKPLIYKVNQENYELFYDVLPVKTDHYIHRSVMSADLINKFILQQAREQSILKFGTAIHNKIGETFESEILPQLSAVLKETTNTLTEEDWTHLKITNSPAAGLGEKILHLYNDETDEDIFRFHVRRDHPPNKGYYFNFHYHTYLDNHEAHHDLGSIYWGKDIPQQWSGEENRIYA